MFVKTGIPNEQDKPERCNCFCNHCSVKSCSSCTCITLQWNADFSNPRAKKLFPFIQSNTVIFLPISLTSRIFKANFVSLRSSKHRDSTVYIKAGSGLLSGRLCLTPLKLPHSQNGKTRQLRDNVRNGTYKKPMQLGGLSNAPLPLSQRAKMA